jgi:hypothetical protein
LRKRTRGTFSDTEATSATETDKSGRLPRQPEGTSKTPRKRWTPAAEARRRHTVSDRTQWKPTARTARAERLKPARWTPARPAAKHMPQQYRDPAARKIARQNHLIEPRIFYSASPQRPGRGWLYEVYASQGRLADYFRLFPNG